jgi:hypothetical protein
MMIRFLSVMSLSLREENNLAIEGAPDVIFWLFYYDPKMWTIGEKIDSMLTKGLQ